LKTPLHFPLWSDFLVVSVHRAGVPVKVDWPNLYASLEAYLDSPPLSRMCFGSVDDKEICRIREIFDNFFEFVQDFNKIISSTVTKIEN